MATEAVLQALRKTWNVIEQANIQAAVAGGLALATWRHTRTTFDVDILLVADDQALTDLTQRLIRAGFARKATYLLIQAIRNCCNSVWSQKVRLWKYRLICW